MKIFLTLSWNSKNYNKIWKSVESIKSKSNLNIEFENLIYGSNEYGSNVYEAISSKIKECELFVALIEGENKNIYIQIGYALGLGKKVVLAVQKNTYVPEYISNLRYVEIDFNSETEEIEKTIENSIKEVEAKEKEIESAAGVKNYSEIINKYSIENLKTRIEDYLTSKDYKIEQVVDSAGFFDIKIKDRKERIGVVEFKNTSQENQIPISDVQHFISNVNLYNYDFGIYVTTSQLTTSASSMAEKYKDKIEIWDVKKLFDKLKLK